MREYTEKELVIFSGVLKLAESGNDLSKITARQIAEAAGMGKATIYDYFSSKEEIIINAIVYTVGLQNERMKQMIVTLPNFHSRMTAVFNEIIDTVENSSSIFSLFSGVHENLERIFHDDNSCSILNGIIEEVKKTFIFVLDSAMADGEISTRDMDYAYMALHGAVFATGKYAMGKMLPRETICKNAYTMLYKALN